MNGWQRLGIVISTVIALPLSSILYADADKSMSTSFQPKYWVESSDKFDAANLNGVLREASGALALSKVCANDRATIFPPPPGMTGYTIRCEYRPEVYFPTIIGWGIIFPFALIFGLGWTVAWVRRGF